MTRSLDFYLALGCEVASTADGWVLLRAESEQFVLAQSPAVRSARAPVLRVRTGDLVALGRRLKHVGATVGARTSSARHPDGQFAATDPDSNIVLASAYKRAHTPTPAWPCRSRERS